MSTKEMRRVAKEIGGKVGFEVCSFGAQFPQSAVGFHLTVSYPRASVTTV